MAANDPTPINDTSFNGWTPADDAEPTGAGSRGQRAGTPSEGAQVGGAPNDLGDGGNAGWNASGNESRSDMRNDGRDELGNPGRISPGSNPVRGIADMARNAASSVQQKAGDQVRTSIDDGRTRAASALQDVARTLTSGADDGAPQSAYLNRAGEQVQRVADYLENADVESLVRDTESFARRQPALFLGGAFALGVLAARFLKSSRPRSSSRGGEEQWAGATDSQRSQQRLYDRETPVSSFRDDYATASSNPAVDEDDVDWPSGMGDVGPSAGDTRATR